MRILSKLTIWVVAFAALWLTDLAPDAPWQAVFVAPAEAVVGRPLTPVSVGGVARRTTRRAVYATSASTAAASQQQAAASQQQAAAPAPAPASTLPAGTVVTALPSGCESMDVDGTSFFNCGGVMYQPKLQSGNLVYVVQ